MKKVSAIPPVFLILYSSLPAMLIMLCSAISARTNNHAYPFEVQISGHGKNAIIFVPGFASSGKVWDETKAKFEEDYTCYTLTMAGFAGVEPQPDASFKNWETSIARYISDNKIIKPIVIGHSMGGVMALALASDYPELIEKIIVVDALPCLAAMSNTQFKAAEKADCSAMIQQLKTATEDQFYQMQKMTISRMVANTAKQEMVIDWSMKSDRNTIGEMFCDFTNTDVREKIKFIKCPALILLEPYFKNVKAAIDGQYQNLKTANIQYSDKGLHFIMYDDKEWYFNQLNNFVVTK